jgi:RNA polymerase sigma factor (sigma-70 family)
MPNAALSAAVARVGRAAARLADPDPAETDGRLLGRFVQTRDEVAFRELVRRLGPMALGVCRRVAGDHHLAEDAFQAAFLVLARRAADVVPREAVRGWLHGVAVRTAQKARAMSTRRRARELPVPAVPDRPAAEPDGTDPDALRVLDEEVGRLPDHLRAAVALCELEGVNRRDAAARLGVPEGTLSSRLAKARAVLAGRLRGRGVALTAAGLCAALGRLASAAVPPRLLDGTAALSTSPGPVPPPVAVLTNGVFRTMFLHKLKLAATAGLVLAFAGVVGGGLSGLSAQDPPKPAVVPIAPKPADEKKPQPAAKPPGPGTLLLVRAERPDEQRGAFFGRYQLLTPDGKTVSEFEAPKGTRGGGDAYLSPDGTRVAFIVTQGERKIPVHVGQPEPWPYKVVVRMPGKPDAGKGWSMPAEWLALCWTADGKRVIVGKHSITRAVGNVENVLLDPETGKTEPLDLPAGAWVLDAARDGKTFLVAVPGEKKLKLGLAEAGDLAVRELAEVGHFPPGTVSGRLSPDGTRVLFTAADPARKNAYRWGQSHRPYLLEVKTKKVDPLAEFPENGVVHGIAWSPDGKQVAYTWNQLHEEVLKRDTITVPDTTIDTEAFLVVADADGKNPRTVASGKSKYAMNMVLGTIDWR